MSQPLIHQIIVQLKIYKILIEISTQSTEWMKQWINSILARIISFSMHI